MSPLPTLAIVGRPNVGKSALFNRIAQRDLAIVFDKPGVTRDRLVASAQWNHCPFTLWDTGGIGLDDTEGFREAIEREVSLALDAATHILFVVDAREGLTHLDIEIARRLRKTRKPVFVVANKIDHPKQELAEMEFHQLALGNPYPVSASHGHGIDDLMRSVTSDWPKPTPEPEQPITRRPTRIAVVGRPNAGKSSLINALVQSPRAIVSHLPGTTRDAVDVPFQWNEHSYVLIDTAGMRKRTRVHDPLETHMTGRTAHMINRADVCILVLETTEGVHEQDQKIAGLISKSFCPCVIAANKWDLVRDPAGRDSGKERIRCMRERLFFIDYAPIISTTATENRGLPALMRAVEKIDHTRHIHIQTAELNRILQQAQDRQSPPTVSGQKLKIYYATQQTSQDLREIPTLILFINQKKLWTHAYHRYLEVQLRKAFDLAGCPLKLQLRER